MTEVRYRPATDDDVDATYLIYLHANEDLSRRLGRPVILQQHSPPERALAVRRAALRSDPNGYWVAEDGGTTVGFGLAIRRRTYWYLAALHVEPRYQASGVGRELLRRCMGDDETRPLTMITISEAANIGANGLYGRFGMFPLMPIVQLEGPTRGDRLTSVAHGSIALQSMDSLQAIRSVRPLDRAVLGTPRDEDHTTWLGVPTMSACRVSVAGRAVGYVYLDTQGGIGPCVVAERTFLLPTILAGLDALNEAGVEVARLRIPGVAREALAALLESGFRYDVGINLLLASSAFGRLDRYLFSAADALF